MESFNAAAAVVAEAFTRAAPEVAASCPGAVAGASHAASVAVHLMVDAVPAQGVPDPAAALRAGPVPASAPPRGPGVAAADSSPVLSVPRRVRRYISRKRRQPLTLGLRIMVINAHEKGDSYARIQETLAPEATRDAVRKTVERKRYYREAAAKPGAMLNRHSLRGCKYFELHKRLYVWFCVLTERGRNRIPVTYAYVGRKAEEIAAYLDINGFKGSLGYVQGWAQRHQLVNVRLHGAAGSVDMDEARLRTTVIRSTLETFDPEFIYNMDESIFNNSGYLYRLFCSRTKSASLDSHMYVSG